MLQFIRQWFLYRRRGTVYRAPTRVRQAWLLNGCSLLFVLLLAGCGPRVGGGEMAIQATDTPFVVDLPALYIDYDSSGTAYLGTAPVAEVGIPFGVDLTRLNLDTAQIEHIVNANIQHLQVTNLPEQLLALVNGKPLPALVWNMDSLTRGIETLQHLEIGLTEVSELLPVIAELSGVVGGGAVLRFPVANGTTPIPLTLRQTNADITVAAQTAYLAAIGTPPQFTFDIFYQADGTWTVDGSDAVWVEILPLPWTRLNLDSAKIETLRAGGVVDLVLTSNQQGLFIEVNGESLPHLAWAEGELTNVIVLAEEGGLFTQLLGNTPIAYSLATTLERLLPMMQMTEVVLRLHFPTGTTSWRIVSQKSFVPYDQEP